MMYATRKGGLLPILFAVVLLAAAVIAEAQQPKKLPQIGYITASSASSQALRLKAFQYGLRDLGYIEGTDIVIEYRYAEGKLDRQGELATELVRLKLDVIVTAGSTVTRAAKKATTTIPIVMAFDTDPV